MSAYDDLTFAPMLITDVLTPHKGKRLVSADRKPGETPFVGGSESYNSITGFSKVEPLFPGDWLTLTYNGSVGHCKLQPAPFFASDDVIALEPPRGVTREALLVCATIITRECVAKYSYGVKLNLARLKRQTAIFPVTTDDTGEQVVDWEGMTRLGEELMAQAITHTHSARTSDDADADADLPDLRFEPMLITDVFETMKSSSAWYDKTKLRQGQGVFPFVSRTKVSNGTDGFTARQEKSPEPGGAVTIGLDTQTVSYQPVPFYTSQNIQVLRHPSLDEDNALVLVSCLREQMGKFSWGGNGATLGRLKATRIMVPVTVNDSGNEVIDWEGMTLYGKILRARAERRLSASAAASG